MCWFWCVCLLSLFQFPVLQRPGDWVRSVQGIFRHLPRGSGIGWTFSSGRAQEVMIAVHATSPSETVLTCPSKDSSESLHLGSLGTTPPPRPPAMALWLYSTHPLISAYCMWLGAPCTLRDHSHTLGTQLFFRFNYLSFSSIFWNSLVSFIEFIAESHRILFIFFNWVSFSSS